MPSCVFCGQKILKGEGTVVLTLKGCQGVRKANIERNGDINVSVGQEVHTKCRKDYTNPKLCALQKKRKLDSEEIRKHVLRSEHSFMYSQNCIFCGFPDLYNGRKVEHKLIPIRSLDFREKILKACNEFKCEWRETVRGRVMFVPDLPAADAVYHKVCNGNFRTGKQMPKVFELIVDEKKGKKRKTVESGRPKDLERHQAFLAVAEFLEENDDEQITIPDLINKMKDNLEGSDIKPYSFPHMKNEIQKYFRDRILITEVNGKQNVVTFHSTVETILYDYHQQNKKTEAEEKRQVIEAAAKLIKQEIRAVKQRQNVYPNTDDFSMQNNLDFVTPSLLLFLETLFSGTDKKNKMASIGQAVMQATRPRVLLAPLQVGLGVQMHSLFQSRFLVDSLHKHGFSCSYSEVKRFERNAAVTQGTNIPNITTDSVLQYAADNVDHNVRSLDGKGTFHGMGMIAMITPGCKMGKCIPRKDVTAEDIALIGRVEIHPFVHELDHLHSLCYEELDVPNVRDPCADVNLMWKAAHLLKLKTPQWSGFMQLIHKGDHSGKSSVMFLPMIDLNPNDLTCVYSTLKFLSAHAHRYQSVPVVTFDQPLWWKALLMVESLPELQPAVIRLGAFHTEMSFLGCIGHIMSGSGLDRVLEEIYANNTVGHMLSGKAVSRAVRGHLLVSTALNTFVISSALGIDLPLSRTGQYDTEGCEGIAQFDEPQHGELPSALNTQLSLNSTSQANSDITLNLPSTSTTQSDTFVDLSSVDNPPASLTCQSSAEDLIGSASSTGQLPQNELLEAIETLMNDLMNGEMSPEDIQHDVLTELKMKMELQKQDLIHNRTAKLWFQYLDMIDLLLNFLSAERLGNWELHLQCLFNMLPYFAASGHNLYVKSVHIYLQKMLKLKEENPKVHEHFSKGNHVIRRTNRQWAGVSTDLAIEQCLMRALKSRGGLTRGRGITEIQRLIWVLSSPATAEMNSAMQDFTDTSFYSNEQHKEYAKSRIERDSNDVEKLLQYLAQRNPFKKDTPTCLRSITTGATANDTVNSDDALTIGLNVLESMKGKKVSDFTYRKKEKCVVMDDKCTVKIKDAEITVDPILLFQRLITAGIQLEKLPEVFTYELSSYPSALFESKYVMLQANKSKLADALWSSENEKPYLQEKVQYVLDGGSLIHKIPWKKGESWGELIERYVTYVGRHYGRSEVHVVFDGYSHSPTTKDCTHMRRCGGSISTAVYFDEAMPVNIQKEEFLTNIQNKQRFINLLSSKLVMAGHEVKNATGDADLLIVETAVACAQKLDTVVIADDTDILVLLIYHATNIPFDIWFHPSHRKHAKKMERCWNISCTRKNLGETVCNNILFAHSLLGCDTTSRLHGIGKPKALAKLKADSFFQHQSTFFMTGSSDKTAVIEAGNHALVSIYNGVPGETLDGLRLRKFCEKATCSSSLVEPRSFPPTSSSAQFHIQRVYQQIQVWLGKGHQFPPEDWGWKILNGKMVPIMMDKLPAPQELLEMIRCGCKTGCYTMKCSCRKQGIECSMACSDCRGVCANSTSEQVQSDSDNDESI